MSVALVEPSGMFKNALSNPHKRKREEKYGPMAGYVFGEITALGQCTRRCFYPHGVMCNQKVQQSQCVN